MNNRQFMDSGNELLSWIEDYLENVSRYRVKPDIRPGQIRESLPLMPPEDPESFKSIIREFEEKIVPGLTHWQHPGFFAYFPSNNSYPSILAEMLSAGLGVQGMLWDTGPAVTELEQRMMEWLRVMLGLPQEFEGVIQDTASSASLAAILCARENASGFSVNENGFYGSNRLRIYLSKEAHSSIEKGAKIAGFGRSNLVYIDTDRNFRMIPEKLDEALVKDIKDGYLPACEVATVGTTSSLAFDPLRELGEICRDKKLYLHVDAAHAGTAAILPEKRHILDGMEYADSFVFNPHKWMLTNFDCSAFFVKDSNLLTRTMSVDPEYLKTSRDGEAVNYMDWHVQLGRRFRALKLWFVIRSYGVEGIRNIIRDHISWAESFASWVDRSPDFERLAPVELNLVCFRFKPCGVDLSKDEIEKANIELIDELNSSGSIYLTHTRLDSRYCLRLCIGQRNTRYEHVEKAWEQIQNSKTVNKYRERPGKG
jgi:aromatic-L-amino-acid decarboxylase